MDKKIVAKELIFVAKMLIASKSKLIKTIKRKNKSGEIIEYHYQYESSTFQVWNQIDETASKSLFTPCFLNAKKPLDTFYEMELKNSRLGNFDSLEKAVKAAEKHIEKVFEGFEKSNKKQKEQLKNRSGYYWD